MNLTSGLLTAAFLFTGTFRIAFAQDTTAMRYSTYLSEKTIQKHLMVFASDSLEGRETAQPGMAKAARYVSEQFASFGLPAVNNNSYYQKIPLVNFTKGVSVFQTGSKILIPGTDYFIADAPAFSAFSSDEILCAGYGISDSVSGWDDYNDIDVNQKVLLIMDGEPVKKGNSLITKSTTKSSWNDNRNRKLQLAKSKNPKAIFFVSSDYKKVYERYNKRLEHGRLQLDTEANSKTIPVIYMDRNTADVMLASNGKPLSEYEELIAKKRKPVTLIVPVAARMTISMEKTSCTNVLGYVEGTDLKQEVIVVSAHLDHLGKREDKIYYGADDDGSGCASILAMAELFAKAKREGKGPRRSILFITFSGEEKGLLGSDYYTSYPVFPLVNTVANLNIDMIGRVDTVTRTSKNYTYLIGSDKLSTQLHSINEAVNTSCCQLNLDYTYNDPADKLRLYYRSDHYNFAKHNIPVIFYFTGLHEDYHKPTDTIDKIDFEKTAGIARLVFNTTWDLANRNERIVVDVTNDFK